MILDRSMKTKTVKEIIGEIPFSTASAVTFYWCYVHVASAFPLAHHYRAVLAWGS
jgi:hypothetical protein